MATRQQRTAWGRIGAYSLHAKYDAHATTSNGRAAAQTVLNRRLLADIDPEGKLSEVERERRLGYARKAHFIRLASMRRSRK